MPSSTAATAASTATAPIAASTASSASPATRRSQQRIDAGKGLHARPDHGDCEHCHIEHQGRDFELVYWGKAGEKAFDHALSRLRPAGRARAARVPRLPSQGVDRRPGAAPRQGDRSRSHLSRTRNALRLLPPGRPSRPVRRRRLRELPRAEEVPARRALRPRQVEVPAHPRATPRWPACAVIRRVPAPAAAQRPRRSRAGDAGSPAASRRTSLYRGVATTCAGCHKDPHQGRFGDEVRDLPHGRRLEADPAREFRPRPHPLSAHRQAPGDRLRRLPSAGQADGASPTSSAAPPATPTRTPASSPCARAAASAASATRPPVSAPRPTPSPCTRPRAYPAARERIARRTAPPVIAPCRPASSNAPASRSSGRSRAQGRRTRDRHPVPLPASRAARTAIAIRTPATPRSTCGEEGCLACHALTDWRDDPLRPRRDEVPGRRPASQGRLSRLPRRAGRRPLSAAGGRPVATSAGGRAAPAVGARLGAAARGSPRRGSAPVLRLPRRSSSRAGRHRLREVPRRLELGTVTIRPQSRLDLSPRGCPPRRGLHRLPLPGARMPARRSCA